MSEDDGLNIFIESIENGEFPGIEPDHVKRGYSKKQISPTQFQISFERHPHLYGRPSKGKASSAYATVRKTFLIDTEKKSAEFCDEKVLDIKIDYHLMAEEDVLNLIDACQHEIQQTKEMKSEEDVRKYAEKIFDGIEWIPDPSIFISDYDPSNSFNSEKYKKELKERFMYEFVSKWNLSR